MKVCIHPLHIGESDLLPQNHLVEGADEEGIEEAAVEDGKTDHAPNELEVVKMFRVDARVRIDLKGVVVVGGIFKETVEGVKHFVGEEEEEFSAKSVSDGRGETNTEFLTHLERPP